VDVEGMGVRRGSLAILLAALLCALAASLPCAPEAGAARSEFFGVVQGGNPAPRDLRGIARTRIRSDRFMLNWGWVQPRDGNSFDWSGPDRLIGKLASHGVRAAPAFWGNPGWVYGSPARPPLERPRDVQAWRNLLRAAVLRYGPGGTYWTTRYRRQHGARAAPLPITSWQIWNEPNLSKFFAPYPSPGKYAQLLRISHSAIKGADPQAQIVLAGMPGYGDVTAWRFLFSLYSVPGVRAHFDAAALHPYARDLGGFKRQINRLRVVMRNHGDAATPLWISEIAWGSAPPDRFGINKGLAGQAELLRSAFELVLRNRETWNVQRLFWYHWRDPRRPQASCSFCGSAGLLGPRHMAKPAQSAFASFSAERTPPRATVVAGPSQGAVTKEPKPSFRFASSEAGSTFECGFDTRPRFECPSRFRPRSPLADGGHRLTLRAVDAAGNASAAVSRSFEVDTVAPKVTISSGPTNGSSSSKTQASFGFAAGEPGARLECRLDSEAFAPCSSPHPAPALAGGEHTFQVRATDRAGNRGPVATRSWTIDSAAPTARILSGPADGSSSSQRSPTFRFASSEAGSRFECRLGSRSFAPCASPHRVGPLADGAHAFAVRAIDAARNRGAWVEVRFTVDTVAPKLKIRGPLRVRTRRRTASAAFTLETSERVGRWCLIEPRRFDRCAPRYRTPRLGGGSHTLRVKVADRAGNVAQRRKRFRVVRARRPGPAGDRSPPRLGRMLDGARTAGG
jgi:hypothetical protein